ncbi:hypothetical protein [Lacrimispora sp. JR3]|uniref:hypothetical protein n=1 Tax=Lacrimispora sinapis TaxID=3111456 RepID=UPI003747969C
MKVITFTEEQILQIKYMLNGITVIGIQNARQVSAIAQVLESGMPGEVGTEETAELKNMYSADDWKNPPERKTKISNGPKKKEGEG